jgi:uncharacterized membrane protein
MSQQNPATFKEQLQTLVIRLRQHEANKLRGDVAKLQDLEEMTDEELLKKWSWMCSIAGLIVCYFIVPFVLSIINRFLPAILAHLLWAVALASMFAVMAMFGCAIYLTVKPKPGDD